VANQEHLRIFKQGVKVWNRWRHSNWGEHLDLQGIRQENCNLAGVDFTRVNLKEASFTNSDLRMAFFAESDLTGADLGASILGGADFYCANLKGSYLVGVDFRQTDFAGANLSRAFVGHTTFAANDLSETLGLDSVHHMGPSSLGIDTLYQSKGKIPEAFLRGCGVPEDFIKLIPSLTSQPFQFYSCFISYSSQDDDFARRLHADLQGNKVRVWFAPEDLKIGDRIRDSIDHSIRIHDKLLLILTEKSIQSDWVEKEVETAFEKERKNPGKTVLFPIRLDDAVMDTDKAWAADIRRTRHIGDFTDWKDHDSYKQAFDRLLRDLKASEG